MTTTTALTGAAETATLTSERELVKLRKRIGSTTFIINVATSPSATENLEQKLLRMFKREVLKC